MGYCGSVESGNQSKGVKGGMMGSMRKRLASRSGQSMIEYLVIAAVVIAAIIAIQGTVRSRMDTLMTESSDAVGRGANKLGTMNINPF